MLAAAGERLRVHAVLSLRTAGDVDNAERERKVCTSPTAARITTSHGQHPLRGVLLAVVVVLFLVALVVLVFLVVLVVVCLLLLCTDALLTTTAASRPSPWLRGPLSLARHASTGAAAHLHCCLTINRPLIDH